MAIVSNYYEEKYLFTKDYKSKKVYKNINLTVLVIGLLIYLYFVIINYENIRNSKYVFYVKIRCIFFQKSKKCKNKNKIKIKLIESKCSKINLLNKK